MYRQAVTKQRGLCWGSSRDPFWTETPTLDRPPWTEAPLVMRPVVHAGTAASCGQNS